MRFARSTLIFYALLTGMLALALAPHTQAQQQDFSNEQLKSFAAAAEAVDTIAMEYGNRAQNAQSQQETLQLREEAQSKMVNAVQNEGLSVETYSAIGQEAQRNPKLRQRILQLQDD
jgi:GTP1/Obg family GTP-binding protein